MFKWLARRVAEHVELEELEDLDELYAQVEELEAKMTALRAEIWEYVDGTLQPLNRRIAQRINRSKAQELNTEEPIQKRGGLMKPQDLRRYGATQQD